MVLQDANSWATAEFGEAELCDRRRTRRLVRLAAALADSPGGTLPGVLPAGAELKAAYRLLAGPEVTRERILQPHLARVRRECARPGEYLLIEDSTSLDFSAHYAAADLGWIGDGGGRGLNLHTTLALRVESWADEAPAVTALGLFAQQVWTRHHPPRNHVERKAERLRRARESERWLASLAEAGRPPRGARWTCVADREADIYESFQRCRAAGVGFLIRACQPRALAGESGSLFTAAAALPRRGGLVVELRARPGIPARRAEVELRSGALTLRGPYRPGGRQADWTVNVVEAREVRAPPGVEPIHWVLFTSWEVPDEAAARRVVRTYAQRWLIEEYHKALKTGVGIERSQLSTRARLEALLGVLALVAVRLLNLKLLATARPEEAVMEELLGAEVLTVLAAKHGTPAGGWTNRTVLVGIARLGGYRARKGDGPPGWQTIWRGWQRLVLMVQGYLLAGKD